MLSETTYHRPDSLDQACNLLSENPEAILLSGCQSLGLLSKEGIVSLDTVIDLNRISELREMLRSENDAEILAMAKDEQVSLEEKKEKTEDRLRLALVPKDPNDSKNVIIEIRAGTGGEEAGLFASNLYRMYSRLAQRLEFYRDRRNKRNYLPS